MAGDTDVTTTTAWKTKLGRKKKYWFDGSNEILIGFTSSFIKHDNPNRMLMLSSCVHGITHFACLHIIVLECRSGAPSVDKWATKYASIGGSKANTGESIMQYLICILTDMRGHIDNKIWWTHARTHARASCSICVCWRDATVLRMLCSYVSINRNAVRHIRLLACHFFFILMYARAVEWCKMQFRPGWRMFRTKSNYIISYPTCEEHTTLMTAAECPLHSFDIFFIGKIWFTIALRKHESWERSMCTECSCWIIKLYVCPLFVFSFLYSYLTIRYECLWFQTKRRSRENGF